MFGFPTRVRYLFHQRPFAGYDWPPEEGIVDRDLDVAISQFAPGAETVKDGLIHTSVGVVNYRPQGNAVIKQPNPLGTSPGQLGSAEAVKRSMYSQRHRQRARFAGRHRQQDHPGYEVIQLCSAAWFQNLVQPRPRF